MIKNHKTLTEIIRLINSQQNKDNVRIMEAQAQLID